MQHESDCGPACANMFLRFFKKDFDYSELKNKILGVSYGDGKGSMLFDIGKFLRENGIDVKIDFFEFNYFNESFNHLKRELKISYIDDLIKQIKIMPESRRRFILNWQLESLKQAIISGVTVEHKLLSSAEIENVLKSSPIIAPINVLILRKSRAIDHQKHYGHFLLVKGFDKEYFYFNDPTNLNKENFGEKKIKKEELIISAVNNQQFPAILFADDK